MRQSIEWYVNIGYIISIHDSLVRDNKVWQLHYILCAMCYKIIQRDVKSEYISLLTRASERTIESDSECTRVRENRVNVKLNQWFMKKSFFSVWFSTCIHIYTHTYIRACVRLTESERMSLSNEQWAYILWWSRNRLHKNWHFTLTHGRKMHFKIPIAKCMVTHKPTVFWCGVNSNSWNDYVWSPRSGVRMWYYKPDRQCYLQFLCGKKISYAKI